MASALNNSFKDLMKPNPMRVLVEKATNEFLLQPDWSAIMELCDLVNQNPEDNAPLVVQALKKQLKSGKPRVQQLSVTLLEALMKNTCDTLYAEVGSRDFMEVLLLIAQSKKKQYNGADGLDVQESVLELIQSWAEEFRPRRARFPMFQEAYEFLCRSNVRFPPPRGGASSAASRSSASTSQPADRPSVSSSANTPRGMNAGSNRSDDDSIHLDAIIPTMLTNSAPAPAAQPRSEFFPPPPALGPSPQAPISSVPSYPQQLPSYQMPPPVSQSGMAVGFPVAGPAGPGAPYGYPVAPSNYPNYNPALSAYPMNPAHSAPVPTAPRQSVSFAQQSAPPANAQPIQPPVSPISSDRQIAKFRSDLEVVRSHVQLLSDCVANVGPREDIRSNEILTDVVPTVRAMRTRLLDQIESIADERLLSEVLEINDTMNQSLERYDALVAAATAGVNPAPASAPAAAPASSYPRNPQPVPQRPVPAATPYSVPAVQPPRSQTGGVGGTSFANNPNSSYSGNANPLRPATTSATASAASASRASGGSASSAVSDFDLFFGATSTAPVTFASPTPSNAGGGPVMSPLSGTAFSLAPPLPPPSFQPPPQYQNQNYGQQQPPPPQYQQPQQPPQYQQPQQPPQYQQPQQPPQYQQQQQPPQYQQQQPQASYPSGAQSSVEPLPYVVAAPAPQASAPAPQATPTIGYSVRDTVAATFGAQNIQPNAQPVFTNAQPAQSLQSQPQFQPQPQPPALTATQPSQMNQSASTYVRDAQQPFSQPSQPQTQHLVQPVQQQTPPPIYTQTPPPNPAVAALPSAGPRPFANPVPPPASHSLNPALSMPSIASSSVIASRVLPTAAPASAGVAPQTNPNAISSINNVSSINGYSSISPPITFVSSSPPVGAPPAHPLAGEVPVSVVPSAEPAYLGRPAPDAVKSPFGLPSTSLSSMSRVDEDDEDDEFAQLARRHAI